jgi:hypothetical protein
MGVTQVQDSNPNDSSVNAPIISQLFKHSKYYLSMMDSNSLIAPETFAIFNKHQNRMLSTNAEVSNLKQRSENPPTFSYNDRFELKKNDKMKQRFCRDVKLSK